jgi:hypothetical protein
LQYPQVQSSWECEEQFRIKHGYDLQEDETRCW